MCKSNPIVSVIVPCYNHGEFLKQRLLSIFNQTFQNFEVILLDDCSIDSSREILLSYANHSKVSHCILNKVNTGNTFVQWNRGINLAKGDYIWIAESDDICSHKFLDELITPMLKDRSIVLSYCQSNRINSEGVITGNWLDFTKSFSTELFNSNFYMDGNVFIERFLIFRNVIPNASAVLFKKQNFIEIGGVSIDKKIKYCADWLFYIQLITNNKLFYHSKSLNSFRYHENSVIAKANLNERSDTIIAIELDLRNKIISFIKKMRPNNFKVILNQNKFFKKRLIYNRATNYLKNNQKLKGYFIILLKLGLFYKEYNFLKRVKNKITNFKNKLCFQL